MKFAIILFFVFAFTQLNAQTNNSYNIVWNSQSKNSSESMPCGGGDIGMNVWVENNELLIYVAKSGNFDENNALMKSGRIRVKLLPNPFDGKIFKQELHLQEGYITVEGKSNGVKAIVKIWADVFNPVAHIDISSNKKINVEAAYESWRYQDRVITARENFGNSYKWAAPKNNIYKKDVVDFNTNEVLFYHYNAAQTIFDVTVAEQGMDAVKDELYNPLKQLAFGGSFNGKNFSPAGTYQGEYVKTDFKGWKLKSNSAAKEHSLNLVLYNAQVNDIAIWKHSLDSIKERIKDKSITLLNTQQWWAKFWSRSFIEIDNANNNSTAWGR